MQYAWTPTRLALSIVASHSEIPACSFGKGVHACCVLDWAQSIASGKCEMTQRVNMSPPQKHREFALCCGQPEVSPKFLPTCTHYANHYADAMKTTSQNTGGSPAHRLELLLESWVGSPDIPWAPRLDHGFCAASKLVLNLNEHACLNPFDPFWSRVQVIVNTSTSSMLRSQLRHAQHAGKAYLSPGRTGTNGETLSVPAKTGCFLSQLRSLKNPKIQRC